MARANGMTAVQERRAMQCLAEGLTSLSSSAAVCVSGFQEISNDKARTFSLRQA